MLNQLANFYKPANNVDANWQELLKQIRLNQGAAHYSQTVYILNPTTLDQFFTVHLSNTDKNDVIPGWVAKHRNRVLVVELTRDISEAQWIRLLKECQQYQVTLELLERPWYQLPPAMHNLTKAYVNYLQIEQTHPYKVEVIITSMVQETVLSLQAQHEIEALEISGFPNKDILSKQYFAWKNNKAQVKHQITQFMQEIKQGKSFILSGDFSQEYIDHLAQLCDECAYLPPEFELKAKQTPGKLYIVSNQEKQFSFATHLNKRQVQNSFLANLKKQFQAFVKKPSKYPVLIGFLGYCLGAVFGGVLIGLGVGWLLTLGIYMRNALFNDFETSFPARYETDEENFAAHQAFDDGYAAGDSWTKYFESYTNYTDWEYLPEFAAGMVRAEKEQQHIENVGNLPTPN